MIVWELLCRWVNSVKREREKGWTFRAMELELIDSISFALLRISSRMISVEINSQAKENFDCNSYTKKIVMNHSEKDLRKQIADDLNSQIL